jgi:hypothetical protein
VEEVGEDGSRNRCGRASMGVRVGVLKDDGAVVLGLIAGRFGVRVGVLKARGVGLGLKMVARGVDDLGSAPTRPHQLTRPTRGRP